MIKKEILDYSEVVKSLYEKYKDSEDSLLDAFDSMASILWNFGVPITLCLVVPVDRSRFPKFFSRMEKKTLPREPGAK